MRLWNYEFDLNAFKTKYDIQVLFKKNYYILLPKYVWYTKYILFSYY